jgi:hypothetical protein
MQAVCGGFVQEYAMLRIALLLMALFQTPVEPPKENGIVVGSVTAAGETPIVQPVRVILLSPPYATLWVSDVQKRLDVYWERYKPAFAQRKEFFFEVSKMAHRDALEYVISRMQRDSRIDFPKYVQTTTDGKFEFTNVPLGEYRIVAISKNGAEDVLWQELVDVAGPVPLFIRLKKIDP